YGGGVQTTSSKLKRVRAFFSLLGLLSMFFSTAGCDANACKGAKECEREGKCATNEKGVCVAGSNQDCKASELRKLHGKCSAKQSTCVVERDDDCKAADDC